MQFHFNKLVQERHDGMPNLHQSLHVTVTRDIFDARKGISAKFLARWAPDVQLMANLEKIYIHLCIVCIVHVYLHVHVHVEDA